MTVDIDRFTDLSNYSRAGDSIQRGKYLALACGCPGRESLDHNLTCGVQPWTNGVRRRIYYQGTSGL